MIRRPYTLFERTALLIAAALLLFSIIAWQAIVWSVAGQAQEAQVRALSERAEIALKARAAGAPAPEGARFDASAEPPSPSFLRSLGYRTFMENVRVELKRNIQAADVRVARLAPPEVWIKMSAADQTWVVLAWRIAGPKASVATVLVLITAALIVLAGAAISARRLTQPLAGLAAAAARVADGERVKVNTETGPSEVRSLAVAFQSMSQRLAEADEQREFMLAGISHDLRTPLARLRVAVELLQGQDAGLTAGMAEDIEEIDRMLGQFLQYVRAGYQEAPRAAVADEVVKEVARTAAHPEDIVLELNAGARRNLPADCLRHSVMNLLRNALEYGRTPVRVRTSLDRGMLTVAVRDEGAGLSEEEWLKALKPFQRLQERGKSATTHSGLGLALVERLVRMSQGSIEATRLNPGFEVRIRLPAREVT